MTDNPQDDQLPALQSIIECPEGEAYVDSKEIDGNMLYSVCCYKEQEEPWKLRHKRQGGLRILLNKQPKQPVHKVRITGHCQKKNCCFGVVA